EPTVSTLFPYTTLFRSLEVTTYRDGATYYQKFVHGGKPVGTLEKKGAAAKTGTIIRFKPDPSIFSTIVFDFETLSERMREAAFLLKGLKIELTDERNDQHETYQFPDGLESDRKSTR